MAAGSSASMAAIIATGPVKGTGAKAASAVLSRPCSIMSCEEILSRSVIQEKAARIETRGNVERREGK
jgi:hypothetical protein